MSVMATPETQCANPLVWADIHVAFVATVSALSLSCSFVMINVTWAEQTGVSGSIAVEAPAMWVEVQARGDSDRRNTTAAVVTVDSQSNGRRERHQRR